MEGYIVSFQIRVKVEGLDKVKSNISSINRRLHKNLKTAVRLEGEGVKNDSQTKHVPIDFGTLMNSIVVHRVRDTLSGVSVSVSAGGAAAPYALAIHEHPSAFDPPSWKGKVIVFKPDGRGPKFLEKPLRLRAEGMAKRIADRIKL